MQYLRRAAALSLAVAALAGVPGEAAAWGTLGHATIGGVADELLEPAARAQVAELLADDLAASGQPSGRRTLAQVASWADELRGTPANRPRWHYDNLPACGPIPQAVSWCPQQQCATQQIEAQAALLADRRQPARARNEALTWLVHLVGDVHQPMHAASNFYAEGLVDAQGETGDRGGNEVPVLIIGAPPPSAGGSHPVVLDLHGIWDRQLVEAAMGGHSAVKATAALLPLARAVPGSRRGGSPLDWARESNALARQQAYAFAGFACRQPHDETVPIDGAYVRAAQALIPPRLALAGARLATLLNRALGTGLPEQGRPGAPAAAQ